MSLRVLRAALCAATLCVALGATLGAASAEETYRFERMWPTLQQPWYFNQPYGVAVDGSGNVYVADTWNHRIQKFDSAGAFVTTWGRFGTGDGQLGYPQDVMVDGSGYVYVADSDNNRIQKFDSAGAFITKWGSLGLAHK